MLNDRPTVERPNGQSPASWLGGGLVAVSLALLSLIACTTPSDKPTSVTAHGVRPADSDALFQLGLTANNQHDFAKAADYFEQASLAEPRNANAPYWEAINLEMSGGDPAKIEQALRSAISRRQTNIDAHIELANFLERLGRYDDALRAANDALVVDESSDDAQRIKAMILADLNRLDEAIALQRAVIARHPKVANDYCQLAYFQERAGKTDHAEGTLSAALVIDPKADTAYAMLGDIKAGQHDLPQAIDNYRKAIALGRREPLVFQTLAKALRATGQDDEAAKVEAQLAQLNKAPQ
jgi:tetratricopeptide (TPR) repeat protein